MMNRRRGATIISNDYQSANPYYNNNNSSYNSPFASDDFSNQLANLRNEMATLSSQMLNRNGPNPASHFGLERGYPRKRAPTMNEFDHSPIQWPMAGNSAVYGSSTPWEANPTLRGYQGIQSDPEVGVVYTDNSFNFDESGYAFEHPYPTGVPPPKKRPTADPSLFLDRNPSLGPGYHNFSSEFESQASNYSNRALRGSGGRGAAGYSAHASYMQDAPGMAVPYYPIPANSTNDVFSPFYGIEELMNENDQFSEMPTDNAYGGSNSKNFESESADDDVSSLMRDAQIIAGVKPDEDIHVSKEQVQIAQEIEITVPSELMGVEHCQLCGASFTSAQMAQAHYAGKKHAQKENQYVRKIYEEKGINVTRFLNKPKPVRKPQSEQQKKTLLLAKSKKYRFACNICSMCFENRAQVDLHITHVAHRRKVFDHQTELLSKQMPRTPYGRPPQRAGRGRGTTTPAASAPPPPDREIGDFFCPVCDKIFNSKQQFDSHMVSKKHLAKVEGVNPNTSYDEYY